MTRRLSGPISSSKGDQSFGLKWPLLIEAPRSITCWWVAGWWTRGDERHQRSGDTNSLGSEVR